MNIIDIALELADEFPVFPCNAQKRPIIDGGFKQATQDPEKVAEMFAMPNAALIGVPTGAVSGISVIDIDVTGINGSKDGKEWLERNKEILGITRIARTRSGGWHYYYRHPDGLRNRANIDGCVDIRGDGGYVIVPPSIGYQWLNNEDFNDFPEQVFERASINTELHSEQSASYDMFGSMTDGREKYMASVIMAAVADYVRQNGTAPTVQQVVDNAWDTYRAKVKSRTGDLEAEGRGITEFKRKAESTIRRARAGLIRDIDKVPPSKQDAPVALNMAVSEPKIERKLVLRSLGELSAMPPPEFLVDNYIINKSLAVLFSAPASYKSFLALDWALCVAHGVNWHGRPTKQGKVIYLALEGQAGLVTRAKVWHQEHGIDMAENSNFFAITNTLTFAEQDARDVALLIQAIEERLGGEKPALIICDTLHRSLGGADENSSTDVGIWVRNADLLREHFDCSFLAVHHTGKSKEKGMRGSSVILASADSAFEIDRMRDSQNIMLAVRKQKDVQEADPIYFEAVEKSYLDGALGLEQKSLVLKELDGKPQPSKPTPPKQKVALDVLDDLLAAGQHTELDDYGEAGIPVDVWRKAVEAALKQEFSNSGWTQFRDRMFISKKVTIFNGLVNAI